MDRDTEHPRPRPRPISPTISTSEQFVGYLTPGKAFEGHTLTTS